MIGKEVSWRLAASHLFTSTAVVTAVDHLIIHSFVQWLVTPHLIQRPAAFYTFTSLLRMKSSCWCEKAADVYVVIIVVCLMTDKWLGFWLWLQLLPQ